MATGNITAVSELISCPVCFEHYRDPRSLKCAHQFCLECLEKIATLRHGQKEITCPTCRVVTPVTAGSLVSELPRPVIANELQEMIKKLLIHDTGDKAHKCDNCEAGKAIATIHCFVCKENMCDMCYTEHQDVSELANHKTAPISDHLFCVTHNEEVTMYCNDCRKGICKRCVRKEHKSHKKEDMGRVARESRKKVREFIRIEQTPTVGPDLIEIAQGKVQDIERQRDSVVGELNHTLDLIRSLEDKVKTARSEVVAKTSADIDSLILYKSNLSELIANQASLVELGHFLVEKASDAELVARAPELQASMADLNSPLTVSITEASSKLLELENIISSMTNQMLKMMKNLQMMVKPTVKALKYQKRIATQYMSDVIFNPVKSHFVVKTRDNKAPINVYDLKFNKLTQFGGGIDGLSGYGCISLDSHRDVYLAACDGHLTTVTMDGQRKDRIDMKGYDLRGVSYISENDLYVVSDVTNSRIRLIDPRAKSITRSFGSRGSNPGQFINPSFITTHTDQGKPVIVVSDLQNHRVQLLDLYGTHLHTYGCPGGGDGQLDNPCGVVVDPTGRIIVCDNGNRRVVSFWTEDGKDKWQCLIPPGKLHRWPGSIGIDTTHKTLAVQVVDVVRLFSWQ